MSRLISLFDVRPIVEQLARGDLVLTPNQRLASRLRAAYAIYCREHGTRVVDAPAVYSINNWIEMLWEKLLLKASSYALGVKPLGLAQEQVLWEQVVEGAILGTALLRPTATAQQAISAYRVLVEWQQDLSAQAVRSLFESDDDCAVFLSWVDEFEKRCKTRQWLPRAKLAERVAVAFEQDELSRWDHIIGVGFDDISPLHQHLITLAGEFTTIELGDKADSINVVGCADVQDELRTAVVWSKQVLKDNPQSTVALVVPDLSQRREVVQRVLQEVFEPQFIQSDQPRRNFPFNFSAGSPLLDAPVIQAAISALSLCMRSMDVQTLMGICHSPFYGLDVSDNDTVCRLAMLLHNEKDFTVSTARFRQLATSVSLPDSPVWHFAQSLTEQANIARTVFIGRPKSPSQWVTVIKQLLEALRWPGARRLDSIEYQQVNQWQSALEQFASLEAVVPTMSFAKAIGHLRGILSKQIFQPQTADSSLQVLGTLEAAGLQFSHIWLLSMSSQQWPKQPAPSALIPFVLQSEEKMPQASAERELEYARRLSDRFIHSAKTVVISYPEIIDENPAHVSALFKHYEQKTPKQVVGKALHSLIPIIEFRRRHSESSSLENYTPGNAPVLTDNEPVSGGSQLFASQSACPFRAFVSHRLRLKTLPTPEMGLGASDRGSLLHRSLELVWEKLNSHSTLCEQSDKELSTLCEDAAQYSVAELAQRSAGRLGDRYCELERKRLQHLLLAWLKIEKRRTPFTVDTIESRKTLRFSQLKLETRIDRVDILEGGERLIIDYKTGKISTSRWWGERPDEPQLPLYCLLTDNGLRDDVEVTQDLPDGVGAVAYAQVRIDGCTFKGVGAEQLTEPLFQWQNKNKTDAGVESWHQLKLHWKKVLSTLANDFISGKSAVDPKQQPKTCQFCEFASICRVNHQQIER